VCIFVPMIYFVAIRSYILDSERKLLQLVFLIILFIVNVYSIYKFYNVPPL